MYIIKIFISCIDVSIKYVSSMHEISLIMRANIKFDHFEKYNKTNKTHIAL
jgi:hypothetical protein